MITLTQVNKRYLSNDKPIQALDEVNLTIKSNTIHGIIGLSGAGKSTLVRTLNKLEPVDSGVISIFDYQDIKKLNKESTRMLRQKLGMIFQNFNLLENKTVIDNILFPISIHRKVRKEDYKKALDLLSEVGLTNYETSYPDQLSGGQKQRVGIARALINDPSILLCDEITSALDPLTTKSILNLIKKLQMTKSLTVVFVTHDMHAIKAICDEVTVMYEGRIVETGEVDQILFNPKHTITKELVELIGFNMKDIAASFPHLPNLISLKFPKSLTAESLLSDLTKTFDVTFNILFANVMPKQEGVMLLSVTGNDIDAFKKGLTDQGVVIIDD
ncbi:MAG: methionine ABC transporter ATP-binding protein [Candidatus Izemoplasmataceae bacterium]